MCRQMTIPGGFNRVSDTVFGTKGTAEVQTHEIAAGGKTWGYDGPAPSMYRQEHKEFFESIRKGEPINDGERAAHSTLMAIMGRVAAYTGKKVTWKEMLASKEDFTLPSYEFGPAPEIKVAVPGVKA